MEFEWHIFPGFTTLQLVDEVQEFLSKMSDPAQFQGRIIFMSMFNDIIWGTKDNERECIANATLVSLFAKRFPAGRLSFFGPGSENKWYSTYNERPQGEWQKEDRFFRGRQIAYMIWLTGAHNTVLDYADPFTNTLRNDNVQEFDTRWDEIRLSMTKIPPDDVLESLYKLRIRESEKLKTVLELFDMEIHQKKSMADYQKLKAMVKRSVDQKLRLRNFDARSERIETGAVVTSRRGQRGIERRQGVCCQWKAKGQFSRGDKCSFRHDEDKRAKADTKNRSTL